jgi:PAS domain-containing protein
VSFSQDDQDAYYHLIKNLSRTARPQICELRMIKQGAEPFWARLDATTSVDQDGVPGWRVVISDITQRKLAEVSLRQSEENLRSLLDQVREMNVSLERRVEERTRALQEANRELEAFGYSVSHDLRAPLRTLQGFSQALLEDYMAELPPKARKYLERIGVAAARMDELIQDLLIYSRLFPDRTAARAPGSLRGRSRSLPAASGCYRREPGQRGDLPAARGLWPSRHLSPDIRQSFLQQPEIRGPGRTARDSGFGRTAWRHGARLGRGQRYWHRAGTPGTGF